jgi:hypothetical protein
LDAGFVGEHHPEKSDEDAKYLIHTHTDFVIQYNKDQVYTPKLWGRETSSVDVTRHEWPHLYFPCVCLDAAVVGEASSSSKVIISLISVSMSDHSSQLDTRESPAHQSWK